MSAKAPPRRVLRCTQLQCDRARLVYKKEGRSFRSDNGFIICKVPGFYCPRCGGSYGGQP